MWSMIEGLGSSPFKQWGGIEKPLNSTVRDLELHSSRACIECEKIHNGWGRRLAEKIYIVEESSTPSRSETKVEIRLHGEV